MKTILKTNNLHKVYRLGGVFNRVRINALDKVEFVAEGCRFRHRCPLAEQICTDVRPGATITNDGREVYCHLVEGAKEKA